MGRGKGKRTKAVKEDRSKVDSQFDNFITARCGFALARIKKTHKPVKKAFKMPVKQKDLDEATDHLSNLLSLKDPK